MGIIIIIIMIIQIMIMTIFRWRLNDVDCVCVCLSSTGSAFLCKYSCLMDISSEIREWAYADVVFFRCNELFI